ncbi:hypothetical protein [Treponema endosymbiont of Eucomonympha sp.]|nr:hypothetical protein [Treponema endosymbiont of Eucomonympha sp.]
MRNFMLWRLGVSLECAGCRIGSRTVVNLGKKIKRRALSNEWN